MSEAVQKPAAAARSPADDADFKTELVQLIPHLRAFARTLCGDPTAADDLAQDAMMKAWDARASFQMGTNMKAWTFMILRNQFYSEKRRSWRQSQLDQEAAERTLVAVDDPEAPVALDELRQGLAMLPPEQREALILVGAGGFAYEEAADICGCFHTATVRQAFEGSMSTIRHRPAFTSTPGNSTPSYRDCPWD